MAENETKEELNEETVSDTAEDTAEEAKECSAAEDPADEALEQESSGTEDKTEDKQDKKTILKKKLDKKDKMYLEKIAELNDKVVRQMAEFDNFRKRTEKEKSAMFDLGAKDIVEKILPVVDNFERGLSGLSDEEKESAFAQGIEKIYKQLLTVLEEAGVKPIEAVGKEFDPNFHNAVMHADDENYGENIVSEEFQKGYMYKDSVVRHSMVKVVN